MDLLELNDGICYTCVTLSTREAALAMFDRYVKDNVRSLCFHDMIIEN